MMLKLPKSKLCLKSLWTASRNRSFATTKQIEEELNTFPEYQEAEKHIHNKKFDRAKEPLRRVINILEQVNQRESEAYLHLQRKLAKLHQTLQEDTELIKALETAIELGGKRKSDKDTRWNDQRVLLYHTLKKDLNKTSKLIDKISAEHETGTDQIKNELLFWKGTVGVLREDFVAAKQNLNALLQTNASPELQGFGLNNLGMTYWWNYVNKGQAANTPEDNEAKNTIPTLKRSILNIENDQSADRLKNLRRFLDTPKDLPDDYKDLNPHKVMPFQRKESLIPLLNIADVILSRGNDQINDAGFWLKFALKLNENADSSNVARTLVVLAHYCSLSQQYIKGEGLFRTSLDFLQNKSIYENVLCYKYYGLMLQKLPNRMAEGDKYLQMSNDLASSLAPWEDKRIRLCFPEVSGLLN